MDQHIRFSNETISYTFIQSLLVLLLENNKAHDMYHLEYE